MLTFFTYTLIIEGIKIITRYLICNMLLERHTTRVIQYIEMTLLDHIQFYFSFIIITISCTLKKKWKTMQYLFNNPPI